MGLFRFWPMGTKAGPTQAILRVIRAATTGPRATTPTYGAYALYRLTGSGYKGGGGHCGYQQVIQR